MTRPGKPTTLTGAWLAMAERAGGVVALARELQIGRETLRRWAAGGQEPGGPARALIATWCRRRGLATPW